MSKKELKPSKSTKLEYLNDYRLFRLTLSDGTSYCQTHLMEKAWNYVQDIEKMLKMFNIVRVDAKGVSVKEVNTKL